MFKIKEFSKNFGPGLLMAATGIGVSHIVQSVQAGANYGYILIWALIFIHIVKYPFFLTSPKYVSYSKKSLLDGYYDLSPKYLIISLLLTLMMVFAMIALVFLVGSAVVANIFSIHMPIEWLAIIYMVICGLILAFGRYSFLDGIIKPIILLMVVTTAIALVTSEIKFGDESTNFIAESFSFFNKTDFIFLISFLGWMPATLDVAVWNSLWTAKKHESDTTPATYKQIKLDFNVGYIITAILAILFVLLGEVVFHEKVADLPSKAIPFIKSFLEIYTKNLGSASYLIIAVGVFFTMFSTVISVLDGFSRSFSHGLNILNTKANTAQKKVNISEQNIYNWAIILIIIGAGLVLLFFMENMKQLVLITTIGSFVSTSIIAILNLKISLKLSKLSDEFKLSKLSKFYYFVSLLSLLALSAVIICVFLS